MLDQQLSSSRNSAQYGSLQRQPRVAMHNSSHDTFGLVSSKHNTEYHNYQRSNESGGPQRQMTSKQSDMSKSRSYILAMKSLQEKLEAKDQRIMELESQVSNYKEIIEGLRKDRDEKNAETAKFLHNKKQVLDPPSTRGTKESYSSKQEHDSFTKENKNPNHNSKFDAMEKSMIMKEIKRSSQYIQELEEINEDLNTRISCCSASNDALNKKLEMAKQQNARLSDNIEIQSRRSSEVERELLKKNREIERLSAGFKQMQDLVKIISENRGELVTKSKEELFMLSKSADQEILTNLNTKVISLDEDSSEGFENTFSDILTHILLNKDLTLQHLDLFNHMRARIKEQKNTLLILEDNYISLKEMRQVLVDSPEVMIKFNT